MLYALRSVGLGTSKLAGVILLFLMHHLHTYLVLSSHHYSLTKTPLASIQSWESRCSLRIEPNHVLMMRSFWNAFLPKCLWDIRQSISSLLFIFFHHLFHICSGENSMFSFCMTLSHQALQMDCTDEDTTIWKNRSFPQSLFLFEVLKTGAAHAKVFAIDWVCQEIPCFSRSDSVSTQISLWPGVEQVVIM